MIPMMNIIAWSHRAPWPELRQVEQDLILSRAIVAIFSEQHLRQQLRIRGGTALNKLHFPRPFRYSEDIDLVRTESSPIGPVLDHIRDVLEPWLGRANFDQSPVAPKLRFKVAAEDAASPALIRVKLEINTAETEAYDPPRGIPFRVDNPWFNGSAEVMTFTTEEMLATKLRALLQREKGRDLFDLAHGLDVFKDLNRARLLECFNLYLKRANLKIPRAEAEKRMFAKLRRPRFLDDMKPLLPAAAFHQFGDESTQQAFLTVFNHLVVNLPGEPWAKTEEYLKERGMLENSMPS
jgi:predicted nucleotidyltransferase component of viral defense system